MNMFVVRFIFIGIKNEKDRFQYNLIHLTLTI